MNASRRGRLIAFFIAVTFSCALSFAAEDKGSSLSPWMIESSMWMAANLAPDPPDFYQLCIGFRLDEKNTLFLNGITWKYRTPLGITMWDPSFDSPDEEYPGYVRSFGVGVGYQRFVWKGLFASLYAIPFLQNFHAGDDRLLRSGFQLYLQAQLGYQIDLFKGRVFLKPAVYANYWPINTNFPDSFQQKEKNWPNYQPFEPHLNIGIRF
jgi:hypothetical protein